MKKTKAILVHIYVWGLLIALYYTLAYLTQQKNLMVSDHIAKYLLAISMFYCNTLLILPKFFHRKKYFLFALAEIGLAFLHYGLFKITYAYLLPAISDYPANLPIKFKTTFPRTLWWFFTYSLYAFGYWYAIQSINRQKQIIELQRQNFINEFNSLKLQINPHFLHNTLNTLFAQALPLSEALANNILKVSNLMRFSLKSLDVEDGKVLLKEELDYLHDLIDIHQLRFNNALHIELDQQGEVCFQKIPALSLITAVENAFKYGDLKDKEHPLRITINFTHDDIHFVCVNKKKKKPVDQSFGLGLNNLRKRLEYTFNGNYSLVTEDAGDYFLFDLKIQNIQA